MIKKNKGFVLVVIFISFIVVLAVGFIAYNVGKSSGAESVTVKQNNL